MINIVFINYQLGYGGAERQLINLVKGLDREKFNPTVLTFYSGVQEKELKEANVRVLSLGKKGRWEVFGFLFRLYQKLKILKPDVIHGYLTVPSILTILFKPFFPKARMIIGLRGSKAEFQHYDWLARLVDSLQCFLSRFSSLIIVNSKAGFRDSINQGYPEGKMIVIPNGIDIERFKPNKEAGLSLRREWGIKDGEIVIGRVGRFDPMKDHPTFLHAAALFAKKRSDVRFVCVGNGPDGYTNELVALANQLGLSDRLLWVGLHADMPTIFNAFDMVSSSSSFGEGFPNVIGEAMACKVPCVVTDVGDSSWIVEKTGIVVPPKNPEALAEGWEKILDEDINEKTNQARLRIENNFSLSHLIQRTEEALTLNGRVDIKQPNIS